MFKNRSLGARIFTGYLVNLAFVAITAGVGYWGLRTIARSLVIVGDEEAPIVDLANEMKLTLMTARNAMEEFKSATSTLATAREEEVESIRQAYQVAIPALIMTNGSLSASRKAGAILASVTVMRITLHRPTPRKA